MKRIGTEHTYLSEGPEGKECKNHQEMCPLRVQYEYKAYRRMVRERMHKIKASTVFS